MLIQSNVAGHPSAHGNGMDHTSIFSKEYLHTRPARRHSRSLLKLHGMIFAAAAFLTTVTPANAADLADAQTLYKTGKYSDCIDLCTKSINAGVETDKLYVLKCRAELTIGS